MKRRGPIIFVFEGAEATYTAAVRLQEAKGRYRRARRAYQRALDRRRQAKAGAQRATDTLEVELMLFGTRSSR